MTNQTPETPPESDDENFDKLTQEYRERALQQMERATKLMNETSKVHVRAGCLLILSCVFLFVSMVLMLARFGGYL